MTPTEFVERFINHYGTPDAPNLAALVEDYEAALRGTKPEILQAASERLIRSHTFRSWPTIGECRAAVDAAAVEAAARRQRQARGYEPTPGWAPPTAESRTRVQALVDGLKSKLKGVV